MKKTGFTLAELLIVLGVIGIVAALIVPAASKLVPDQNKVLYLKVNDTISTTIDGLKNNSKLYPVCSNENIDCSTHPLFNNRIPLLAQISQANDSKFREKFKDKVKLCNLLAFSFGSLDNANCSSDKYTYSDSTFANNVSFITQDGMQWIVSPYEYSYDESSHKAKYQTDIWVDLNGNAGPNCIYSENCKNPDRFKFMVAADGTIVQADPKGIMYVDTRKSYLKNKADDSIDTYTIATALNDDIGKFTYKSCGEGEKQIPTECLKNAKPDNVEYKNPDDVLCGLIFNRYRQVHNDDSKTVEIILTYPAVSDLVYTPIIKIAGVGATPEVTGPSCTIPKGSKGCRIDDQLFFDKYLSTVHPNFIPKPRVFQVPSSRGGSNYYNLIAPQDYVLDKKFDYKYIYYGSGNAKEYVSLTFSHLLP